MTDLGAAHPVLAHAQRSLFVARNASSRRASSYDRSGANADYIEIGPAETAVLMQHEGPGCITHFYCGMVLPSLRDYRGAILRCFWDGSDSPSVEVPLGDFFGLAHGRVRAFSSRMLAVNHGCGSSHGLNAYFPMPFAGGAVITLENRQDGPFGGRRGAFWYHVDYETYADPLPGGIDRFHASYRQERPTTAVGDQPNVTLHGAVNDTGDENYVVLDTLGSGRMVGLLLEIDNVQGPKWYGEGDDMVFVDGEPWPPAIHGTGTEEIFGGGACPSVEYASLYTGYHLIESPAYDGLVGMYRWFEPDPIHFRESLRWSIEHGHADNFGNDYSSVAYWYQSTIADLAELPSHADLAPPLGEAYEAAFETIGVAQERLPELSETGSPKELLELCEAAAPFYAGRFDEAREAVERLLASPGWRPRS